MVAKKGKDIARRPMSIIEARFDLSRRQNDIMDILLSKFDEAPPEQTTFVLKVADIKNLYQMDDKSHAYEFLYKAVKTFEGKGFRLKDKRSETWYSWFTKISYIKGNNEENSRIEIKVDDELKNIMVQSRQNAYYKIEYSLNLESKYSKRIYYYLIDRKNYQAFQNAEKGVFKVGVKELMEMLQCPKTYKYGNLKQTVLEKAYEEINGFTDIEFEYEEIEGKTAKGQRAIVEIQFRVKEAVKRKGIIDEVIPDLSSEIRKIIELLGCSTSEAETIHNVAEQNNRSWDEVLEVLDYTIKQNPVKKVGYVLSLLKKGFVKPNETKQPENKFHNFEGRNYTEHEIKELEKILTTKGLDNYEVEGQIKIDDYPELQPEQKKRRKI